MTPQMEQELIRKVDAIHTALVGYDGKNGLLGDVRDLQKRTGALEKWRWYIVGALALGSFAILVLTRTH